MLKIFTLIICAALIMLTTSAHAQSSDVDDVYVTVGKLNASIDKTFSALPVAETYKSHRRPIMIEGAMNLEIDAFVRALKNPVRYSFQHYLCIAGTYKNYPVVVVRTEMGMSNSAASTALAIEHFNPIAVINQGTAGGHDPALKVGSIVIGEKSFETFAIKVAHSEAGAGIDFTNQEMLGTFAFDTDAGTFQQHKNFSADPKLLQVAKKVAADNKNFSATVGTIATSDDWILNRDYMNFLHETYGSSCEEMETHAAAQICHNANIPFIGIRVLSNNFTYTDEFSADSAETCQKFVLLVVDAYIRDELNK